MVVKKINRMEKLLVSIIVPVYKSEAYLSECIESILCQKYSNWELLLVEDGSPDNCGAICDEYSNRDARIRSFHKENGGASSARNYGLNYAKGDFVMFVDSDDRISCEIISDLVDILKVRNADVIGSELMSNKKYGLKEFRPEEITELLLYKEIDSSPCTKLISRKTIGSLRFVEGRITEDFIFLLQLYRKCTNILYTSRNYYYYRPNEDSVTHTINDHYFDTYRNIEYIDLDYIEKYGLRDALEVFKLKTYLDILWLLLINKSKMIKHPLCKICFQNVISGFTTILRNTRLSYKYKVKSIIILIIYSLF